MEVSLSSIGLYSFNISNGRFGANQISFALDANCDALACIFSSFQTSTCLLYTSDAADERSSVDLGGRRIIKKKNNLKQSKHAYPYMNIKKDT